MKNLFKTVCLALVMSTVTISCRKDAGEDGYGYLTMEINTLESTTDVKSVMGAPDGYNPEQLFVEILDANGKIVRRTDDFANDSRFREAIRLATGKYTVNAHSYGWDGSDSGFNVPYYSGSADAVVKLKELSDVRLTCTLANVKVSVNYDSSFKSCFKEAITTVSSLQKGVTSREFVMNATSSTAYFPAGGLVLALDVVNNEGVSNTKSDTLDNVAARQWVKINYTITEPGNLGGVTVMIDDECRTYEFNLAVPRKPGFSLECVKPRDADVWSRFVKLKAEITGKTSEFENNGGYSRIVLQWRARDAQEWNEIANSQLTRTGDTFTYTLRGLNADTDYEYRAHFAGDEPVDSETVTFTTDAETGIYNPGFENWYVEGKISYPNEPGCSYWCSSNPGSASYIGSVTTQDTGFKHSGNSSARLASDYAVIKLAAGSLFTGAYNGLIGTNGAKLDWGIPFTSRPAALKGYWHYKPGKINRGNHPAGAPDTGSDDEGQIFCVLLTEQLHVGGNAESGIYEKSTTFDWQNDSRIIAYGELTRNNASADGIWDEFKIDLKYYKTDVKPTYMAIVCSSSRWGDYFYGSDSTVMWLDDIEFLYSDSPVLK